MPPSTGPSWLSPFTVLPMKNCAPPFENWMITGEFTSRAAASVALTVCVLMQLTAGMANPVALA